MPRKLKVYSANIDGRQYGLVATTSLREAARLFGISLDRMTRYGSETGNAHNCALALSKPGVAMFCSDQLRQDWH